jgi:general secretion pathway protein K
MRNGKRSYSKQRAIALIAVLWIVAALSIAATGIMQTIRAETRVTAAAKHMAEVQATGEAAIMIVLQGISSLQPGQREPWMQVDVAFAGKLISVESVALNGFVDLNRASPELLALTFEKAGGLAGPAGILLSQAVVQARQEKDSSGQQFRFEAVEDLMRVPGISYDVYARLRPLITVDSQGSGKVNLQAAPLEVLTVLAGGDSSRAMAMVDVRQRGAKIDSTALRSEFTDNTVGSRYRLKAVVPMNDGFDGVVLHDVDLNPSPRDGLPWRIFNAETWMQALPSKAV